MGRRRGVVLIVNAPYLLPLRMNAMKLRIPGGRIIWLILAAALLVSMAVSAVLVRAQVHQLARSHQTLASNLVHQLANASHLALLIEDREELQQIALSAVRTDPIISTVRLYGSGGHRLVKASRTTAPPSDLQQYAATIARALTSASLPFNYRINIPPPGEGTRLAPFGTPRAGLGSAVLSLSSAHWTRELARALLGASLVGLFAFAGLLLTTVVVAWIVGRPLARLGPRLSELSGTTKPVGKSDFESSLAAIDERLTQSEDRARQASEALREREAALDRAQQRARDAARLRSDMIASVSHELRTPLTAILGHTDMLADTRLNKDQQTQVATIQNSANHLLKLLDSVLDWSSIDTGHTSLDEVGFNVTDIIEETVTLLAPMAYEKGLELVHLVYQDVPVRLRGDPLRFQQVLTNLVANAIKFTNSGSVVVRAMLEQETADDVQLRVSVADTGPGIPADDQKRLFMLYERLGNDASQTGNGMGLAISKRLLELMGGAIDIDSTRDSGSEFYFTLPLRKTVQDDETSATGSQLAGHCIWLAEAFAPARHALKHHLETWQTTVVEFDGPRDLRSAMTHSEGELPEADAIILCLSASEADCTNLSELLQAQTNRMTKPVPVMCLVATGDKDINEQLERGGATRSMSKSTSRLLLYRELCEALGLVSANTMSAASALADMQVLVAEDNPANQRYLRAQLTELGAGVALAGSGDEAIAAWRKGAFPLVFADDRMPTTSGPEVFTAIRAMAGESAQPVLIGITADPNTEVRDRFLEAGADACLVKPFDAAQIAQRVAPLLNTTPAPAAAGTDLTTDPDLARLLAQELPQQLADVESALAEQDLARAREHAHTLHGTAAFYRLDALKAAAAELETKLAADRMPGPDAANALHSAAQQAQQALAEQT